MLSLFLVQPAEELVNALKPALSAGFLLPTGDEYNDRPVQDPAHLDGVRFQFRHDRIREVGIGREWTQLLVLLRVFSNLLPVRDSSCGDVRIQS